MELLKGAVHYTRDTFQNIFDFSIGAASVSIFLAFFLTLVMYYIIRDYGIPPGPTGVPFLGYWPFLDITRLDLQQIELKKKYGDIFSFRTTGALFINLASMKVLKEAHITKTDYFRERPPDFHILARVVGDDDKNNAGVVFSRGDKWLTIRKFFLMQFRDRGMTLYKENTADTAEEIISTLIDDLRKSKNEPVDILQLLVVKSNLMIRNTLFGFGTPVTEEEVNHIQEEFKEVLELINSKNMLLIGNFAKYFVTPFLPFYKERIKIQNNIRRRFKKIIEDHVKTYDNNNIRDIIDSYIHERNIRKYKGDETYKHFTDETLISNLLQFVGDGVVSVATFVTFKLTGLLDHPEEQEKIYKEIIEVCGEDRNPTMADKGKLKYFNAFLFEASRTSNFVTLFPNLECTEETTVGGYRIPKGSVTVTNVNAIHNDPKVYKNPEKFNPSRFLEVNGTPREELPITFGVGKRVCLGEGFVHMQVYVYLATIVKNFKLSYEVPKTKAEIARARSLKVLVTPRK